MKHKKTVWYSFCIRKIRGTRCLYPWHRVDNYSTVMIIQVIYVTGCTLFYHFFFIFRVSLIQDWNRWIWYLFVSEFYEMFKY